MEPVDNKHNNDDEKNNTINKATISKRKSKLKANPKLIPKFSPNNHNNHYHSPISPSTSLSLQSPPIRRMMHNGHNAHLNGHGGTHIHHNHHSMHHAHHSHHSSHHSINHHPQNNHNITGIHNNGHNHNIHNNNNHHPSISNPNPNHHKSKSSKLSSKSSTRKIRKFVRCSTALHRSLRTTTSPLDNKLEIIISRGRVTSDLLYIKQHTQYQVRYNDEKQSILLATIPKQSNMKYNYNSIATFTQYIINNKFIRFRNRGPTQSRHVSLWRIYKFKGERTLFNIWSISILFKSILQKNTSQPVILQQNLKKKKKKKKKKIKDYNYYHSNANTSISSVGLSSPSSSPSGSSSSNASCLDNHSDLILHIFSFITGSKYHCWIHIHEIIDKSHHRSNLLGLEFDSTTNNVYVMQRSPALLKKIRQIGDKFFTRKIGVNSILTDAFFKKSVEMFKAVY